MKLTDEQIGFLAAFADAGIAAQKKTAADKATLHAAGWVILDIHADADHPMRDKKGDAVPSLARVRFTRDGAVVEDRDVPLPRLPHPSITPTRELYEAMMATELDAIAAGLRG